MATAKQDKNLKDNFRKQKNSSLSAIDNSRKGSIDTPIVDIVNFINNLDSFFTTSSCSGRVSVISDEGKDKKKGCKWLFMSHEEITANGLIQSVKDIEGINSAVLKYESFVVHIQCETLEKGQKMLQVALQAGFRNSGLVIGRKKRIMLAIRSTHVLEIPIIFDGMLMVPDEYLTKTAGLCNEKMAENFRRINRFSDDVRAAFDSESKVS
eukprot:gene15716-17301_t